MASIQTCLFLHDESEQELRSLFIPPLQIQFGAVILRCR